MDNLRTALLSKLETNGDPNVYIKKSVKLIEGIKKTGEARRLRECSHKRCNEEENRVYNAHVSYVKDMKVCSGHDRSLCKAVHKCMSAKNRGACFDEARV